MRLLIDIPDTTYAFVKELQGVIIGRGNCKTIQQTVINAIKFGVKQPQGEWQKVGKYACECSICGEIVCGDFMNFCPNCGADMRKGDTE